MDSQVLQGMRTNRRERLELEEGGFPLGLGITAAILADVRPKKVQALTSRHDDHSGNAIQRGILPLRAEFGA